MAVNFIQTYTPQRNNINVQRRINVENTYSVQNIDSRKIPNQTPQLEKDNINNSLNSNEIGDLRAEINEVRRPDRNITNILREREGVTLQKEINELNESVRNTERSQIKNIEERNANIAQGSKPLGVGARLINNFFTNLNPNLGGKVDTFI